jgi:predicted porin
VCTLCDTLSALAALTASTAFAQSSVTLYGVADVWFGQLKSGDPATRVAQTKIDSGGLNGSRWGLRGSEDLGGGLKGNFVLESGFNIDTGGFASNSAGGIFGRNAWVGLSGGFGAVKLGRSYTAYDDVRGNIVGGVVFDSAFSPIGDVFGVGGDYASRGNNQFHYATPNFGGISAGFSHSLGEDKTATASASSITAFNVAYANGPISAGYAYQGEKAVGGVGGTDKYNFIGGAYDFGFAKLTAVFNTRKQNTDEDQEVAIGVQVPFGAVTLGAGFASNKNELGSATVAKSDGFGLAATYDLSKRTTVYAGIRATKVEDGAGVETNKTNLTAVGIRHRF